METKTIEPISTPVMEYWNKEEGRWKPSYYANPEIGERLNKIVGWQMYRPLNA